MFYSDYSTSLVRPMFEQSTGTFVMGPPSGGQTPVEMTLQFVAGPDGRIVELHQNGPNDFVTTAQRTGSQDIAIAFDRGDARLSGTLILPEGAGPHPAIILLHGSGPLTRNSFGPYPRFFSSLGLAVLIFDKRGTGASTGRLFDASTGAPAKLWPEVYPDTLLADASAAFSFLKSRPEIYPMRIGVWGASEGGMLATQFPAVEPSVHFAINSSGFVGPLWETIYYQGGAILRRNGATEAEISQANDFNLLWMKVARTGSGYDEFIKRREALRSAGKKGWFYYFSSAYSSLEQMRWSWDHILAFNSVPALARVHCPVLGIFGQADALTDAPRSAAALQTALTNGGNRDVTVKVIPGATHSLNDIEGRGMATGVFDTLRQWIASHA